MKVGGRQNHLALSSAKSRNPHGYFSHVLGILLAESREEQAFFMAGDVMEEADRTQPYEGGC